MGCGRVSMDAAAKTIVLAARGGLLSVLRKTLRSHSEQGEQSEQSKCYVRAVRRALCAACERGNTAIVKCLLGAGADVRTRDGAALRAACAGGFADIVALLLGGDEAEARAAVRANKYAAMTAACAGGHLAIVDMLTAWVGPEAMRRDGYAALVAASCRGHTPVVERILQVLVRGRRGPDAVGDAVGSNGYAPLKAAVYGGHTDTAAVLWAAAPSFESALCVVARAADDSARDGAANVFADLVCSSPELTRRVVAAPHLVGLHAGPVLEVFARSGTPITPYMLQVLRHAAQSDSDRVIKSLLDLPK